MTSKTILLFLFFSAVSLFGARPALAAGVVGNGTPASCTFAALNKALDGGGTITFRCGAGTKTLAWNPGKAIALNTVIDGGGKIELEIAPARYVRIKKGVTLTLVKLTIQNAASDRGALENYGTLILKQVTLRNNASTNNGGAITNHGTLKIRRSTFLQNTSQHHGGAIYSDRGTVSLVTSTLSGNRGINGGGLYTDLEAGKTTVTRSTFSDNTAGYAGAGMYTNSTATVTNSTFTGNASPYASGFHRERGDATVRHVTFGTNPSAYGAGFSSQTSNGTLYVQNSVFASTGYNCNAGVYVSLGNNVASDSQCAFLTASGDMQNTDAKLGALGNNGGPTRTHLPANDSPLLNAAADTNVNTDQRGLPRSGKKADIGSVEAQQNQ